MSHSSHSFEVFADYFQFCVWDAGLELVPPCDLNEEDVRRMVKVEPNVVVVLELVLCEADPGCEDSKCDHVVECGVALPTGKLQVVECGGRPVVFDLKVSQGSYRMRVEFAGLATLSEDGIEGDDRYKLTLWPGPPAPLRIRKQWKNAAGG